ncbi:MAG: putative bifunctional diguanylate cyclase/phosphodiesterase [Bacilli bacterium]
MKEQKAKDGKRFNLLLNSNKTINSVKESLIIVLFYSIFGFLWIISTDTILSWLVKDPEQYSDIQTIKGWIFIILTVMIIYVIVKKRLDILNDFIEKMYQTSHILTQTEERLHIQKAQTEQIIGQAPVMIAIWDNDGNLKSVNPYALEALGYESSSTFYQDWENLLFANANIENLKKIFKLLKSNHRLFNVETELIKKNGDKIIVLWNSGVLPEQVSEFTEYVSFGIDITEKRQNEDRLQYLAFHDSLTGLPNRDALEIMINTSFQTKDNLFALLYIDVDNFKFINDTLGHNVGDELLKHIGKSISSVVKEPHFNARLGGDEFAIVINNFINREQIIALVEQIKQAIGKTWFIYNHNFFVSISVGVAISKTNGLDFNTLSKNADIAMYHAKKEGKDRVVFFDEAIENNNLFQIDMAKKIQKAIELQEFELFYQPQYNLKNKQIYGFEALIRWKEENIGYISPADFIPIAEETGQIFAIEKWVFNEALSQKKKWDEMGFHNFSLSINLSSKTLISEINFATIEESLANFDGDLSSIIIEITETAIITDMDKVISHANKLKDLGVNIALDDFGTGYSSLTHIKLLPIDIVKLDRGFINQIDNKGKDEMIVNSVIYLVKKIGYKLIAEGIEQESQIDYLIENECEYGQGFLLNRPMNVQKATQLLKDNKTL